jgi:hypothetical protein
MVNPQILESLRSGWRSLRMSEKELQRPVEDTVTFCACTGSRNAVTDFLKSYLIARSIRFEEEASMEELMTQCVKLDSEFNLIDLSCFACGSVRGQELERHYCLGLGNVSDCCDRAGRIGDLVMEKLDVEHRELES